jgi:hypothetical protein
MPDTVLPLTVPLSVDVAATVVFHVSVVFVVGLVVVFVVVLMSWLSLDEVLFDVLLLSVFEADESSLACGLPVPLCVVVAVADCVTVESLPLLPLLMDGLASAVPDANMKAIAVAKVLLFIEILHSLSCGAGKKFLAGGFHHPFVAWFAYSARSNYRAARTERLRC